jgi:hypothetical protein
MQLPGPLRYRALGAALACLTVGGSLLATAAFASQVKFESGPAGELGLRARGATIEQTLQALAAKAGFDVAIAGDLPHQRADLTLSLAPVERLLHEILRGRNYALLYDGGSNAVRRVIVLPPASARVYAAPRRSATRGGRPAGPLVIRSTANGGYAVPRTAPAKRTGQKPTGALVIRQ